jgi:hypothetical protein
MRPLYLCYSKRKGGLFMCVYIYITKGKVRPLYRYNTKEKWPLYIYYSKGKRRLFIL